LQQIIKLTNPSKFDELMNKVNELDTLASKILKLGWEKVKNEAGEKSKVI
jgi:hypothetical protein